MELSFIARRLELPYVSQWINDDVRPIESSRRTWNFWTFHNFWLLTNCSIATFLTGSALIPFGLTWWQAIICIVIGNVFATAAVIAASLVGAYYHIGFSVFSRAVWGLWGSHFVIWNRIFLSLVWYGFQSFVGGQCFYLILLSWNPNLEESIPNTLPESTGTTTAQFISYIIFCVISLPFIYIRPHKLSIFFYFTSTVTMIFFLSLLIWSLATMGPGGFGDTLDNASDLPATGGPDSTAWLMVYGIMSTIGSIAAGILNQNDFSRLSRRPRDAILGQVFASFIYSIAGSVIGVLVVAATQRRLGGEAVWNPPMLFTMLLAQDDSAGTRVACFFAGLALSASQIGANVPGNALAGGIDLASVLPRWVNVRRGAYITALLSPIVNPWQLVNTPTTFLTVLSSYGVFLAPMTGMMVAHYHLVSKEKIDVDGLYRGDRSSIYWYEAGVNLRAPVAWIIGVVPCLPGFIAAVNESVAIPDGLTELYYMNYLYGFISSMLVYYLLHIVFPSQPLDAFVKQHDSAAVIKSYYNDRWEVTLAQTVDIIQGGNKLDGQAAEENPKLAPSK